MAPFIRDLPSLKYESTCQLRSNDLSLLQVPRRNAETLGDRAFNYAAWSIWNIFPISVRQCKTLDSFRTQLKTFLFIDREPRGASLAEKVANFYACSSNLHTLSYVKVVVCRIHSGGYGQGGDEIKLLLNCIAVIKKSIFYSITRKITCIVRKLTRNYV